MIAVCIAFSYLLRFEFDTTLLELYLPSAYWMIGISLILKPLIYIRFGLYRHLWAYASVDELRLILIGAATASGVVTPGVGETEGIGIGTVVTSTAGTDGVGVGVGVGEGGGVSTTISLDSGSCVVTVLCPQAARAQIRTAISRKSPAVRKILFMVSS